MSPAFVGRTLRSAIWRNLRASSSASANGTPPPTIDGSNENGSAPRQGDENGLMVPGSADPHYHPSVLAVPVSRRPLLPGFVMPVRVLDESAIAELEEMRQRGKPYVGAFLLKEEQNALGVSDQGNGENSSKSTLDEQAQVSLEERVSRAESEHAIEQKADHMHDCGTFAQVHNVVRQDSRADGAMLLLMGHRRIRKKSVERTRPLVVGVDHLEDEEYDSQQDIVRATASEVLSTIKDLLRYNPMYREQLQYYAQHVSDFRDPGRLSDLGASLCSAEDADLQQVLEMRRVPERLDHVLLLLKKEVELSKLQQDISKKVEEKINADQRKYFLYQQLRSIKKELGIEKDDKEAVIAKYKNQFAKSRETAPKEAIDAVDGELDKLQTLEASSAEAGVSRNYLDWLTTIPWGLFSDDRLDLEHCNKVLEEDHHGLKDVKDRIKEFVAVGSLRGSVDGKIVCLVGPPGTGKTSIARSLARAVGREYHRFSVGGMNDVSELKGHRRTYVGAMPGKVVQTIRSAGVSNPLILIDEIDKLGRGMQGDPASALLELLDPEQNSGFRDHFLDVPMDLSKVLFVCTANSLETIPSPLLDRMETIRLSGYLASEKESIARGYLEPKARTEAGLNEQPVTITGEAMAALIDRYCREAGVRSLQRQLEKIYRKAALQILRLRGDATEDSKAESSDGDQKASLSPIVVQANSLRGYIGPEPFPADELYDDPPPGVCTGLAWTQLGGAILHIECQAVESKESKNSMQITGQLGDVMSESARIAYSHARSFLKKLKPESTFFDDKGVHLHAPAGGTPKDGPSAGCTMVTALLSLALGGQVDPKVGLTGEVTLTGKVLPVGGIKEKLIASKRAGLETVILPSLNSQDVDELDREMHEDINIKYVDSYDEILNIVLGDLLGGGVSIAENV